MIEFTRYWSIDLGNGVEAYTSESLRHLVISGDADIGSDESAPEITISAASAVRLRDFLNAILPEAAHERR